MGFFRGSLLFFLCILLFFSLLAANIFLTLSTSLKYENVQQEISPLIQELSSGSNGILGAVGFEGFDLSTVNAELKNNVDGDCLNATEYVFDFDGYAVMIPCSSLNDETTSIVDETVKGIVQEAYYRDYDCGFWKCFREEQIPFFLVSQKARDYWQGKFYLLLIVSFVLVALAFLFVENKLNWPIVVGSVLIVSSLPLLKIESIISFFIPDSLYALSLFLGIFFSKAYAVFWISFIIGLVLIGLGFGLKFSNADFVKRMTEKSEKKPQEKKQQENVVVEPVKKSSKKRK